MDVLPIPIFQDNYVWALVEGREAVVVDPGEAAPVEQALKAWNCSLSGILITHWHPDHIGGIARLTASNPVSVYGPAGEASKIPELTRLLSDGDRLEIFNRHFDVIALPGHTLGHIGFFSDGMVLCGDTLFSAGCGRLFEGTPEQMNCSLQKLAALPDSTRVYCTHEYTLSNLAFASAVDPHNRDLIEFSGRAKDLRARGLPTLPSSIGTEKQINPFMRCHSAEIRKAVNLHTGKMPADNVETFAALRRWKDSFRPPAA